MKVVEQPDTLAENVKIEKPKAVRQPRVVKEPREAPQAPTQNPLPARASRAEGRERRYHSLASSLQIFNIIWIFIISGIRYKGVMLS